MREIFLWAFPLHTHTHTQTHSELIDKLRLLLSLLYLLLLLFAVHSSFVIIYTIDPFTPKTH